MKRTKSPQQPTREKDSQLQILKHAFYTFAEEVAQQFQRIQGRTTRSVTEAPRVDDLEAKIVRLQAHMNKELKKMSILREEDLNSSRQLNSSMQSVQTLLQRMQSHNVQTDVARLKGQFNQVIQSNAKTTMQTLQPLFAKLDHLESKAKQADLQFKKLIEEVSVRQESKLQKANEQLEARLEAAFVGKQALERWQEKIFRQMASQAQQSQQGVLSLKAEIVKIQKARTKTDSDIRKKMQQIEDQLEERSEQHRQDCQAITLQFKDHPKQLQQLHGRIQKISQLLEGLGRHLPSFQAEINEKIKGLSSWLEDQLSGMGSFIKDRDGKHKQELEKIVNYVIESEKALHGEIERVRGDCEAQNRVVQERVTRQDALLQHYRNKLMQQEQSRKQEVQNMLGRFYQTCD